MKCATNVRAGLGSIRELQSAYLEDDPEEWFK